MWVQHVKPKMMLSDALDTGDEGCCVTPQTIRPQLLVYNLAN